LTKSLSRHDGHFINFRAFSCDDDLDAIEWAKQLVYRKAHERLVDNPPWLCSISSTISPPPGAMSPKVKGFVSPQSWFVDLTFLSLQ
jgi:hypothetical protein